MKKILVVVDMQNDFIDGPLGNAECQAVVSNMVEKIKSFDGDEIIYTLDTHKENYLETQEGKNLPVVHCVEGTKGWELNPNVKEAIDNANCKVTKMCKPTFGSVKLAEYLKETFAQDEKFEIELCGVCTGICVISNTMLVKAFFTEALVSVDASCSACVTPESHKTALEAMKLCQIEIKGE
ncbi:MAG: cysteine hydrolase [Lachnospiraceae bacterium]|nr:cysteine hydrolase [Lachnospiraceae bacterium]